MITPVAPGNPAPACPACSGRSHEPWALQPIPALRCLACGLVFLHPLPDIPNMYNESYYDHWMRDGDLRALFGMKIRTSLDALSRIPAGGGKLLDVGCAHGYMLAAAKQRGFTAFGLEVSPAAAHARSLGFGVTGTLDEMGETGFRAITLIDVIEHVSVPSDFLPKLRQRLLDGGALVLITPDISSLPARLLRTRWPHYKLEHVCYYSPRSMRALLRRSGFVVEHMGTARKSLSPVYIRDHFARYSKGWAPAAGVVGAIDLLPESLRSCPISFPSELLCVARKAS